MVRSRAVSPMGYKLRRLRRLFLGDLLTTTQALRRERWGGPCDGDDLPETLDRGRPVREQGCGPHRAGAAVVLLDQLSQLRLILGRHLTCGDAVAIQLLPLEQIGGAAGHARARIPADGPERHGDAASHVLAEM